MATVAQLLKNKTTIITMQQVLEAEASDKGLYLNIKLGTAIYSVDSKLLSDNIDNPTFEFKVSKNGLWLVDNKLTFVHDTTM